MTTPSTRRKKWIALIVGGIVLLLAIPLMFGTFSYSSVCTQCGAMRMTSEWKMPVSRRTVYSTSSESQTPVSAVLVRGGVVSQHEHQWKFCSGGGDEILCAIGKGRHIRPAVQSEGVATILDASQRFGEVPFRDRLLQTMFDSKTSEAVYRLGQSVPENGFADAVAFRAWMEGEMEYFDETVRSSQER
jgi:hypothetical protein